MYGTGFRGRLHDSVRPRDICLHHIYIGLKAKLNRVPILGFCRLNLVHQDCSIILAAFLYGSHATTVGWSRVPCGDFMND